MGELLHSNNYSPIRLSEEVLRFQKVHKKYGRLAILNGLSLRVRKGEVYGFLGRNGAGKSTSIRIAMGISKANQGSVKILGEHVGPKSIKARQTIGYVAQEQHFYGWMTPLTLGKFVRGFYPKWDEAEYQRLIKVMDLPAKRKIQTFSGGMKAKQALALALAHHPQLLILDDPTAGLDAVARREFIEMVRDQALSSQRTTFFSSHLIDEVEAAADRVGIIEGGKTIYEGSLDSLQGLVLKYRCPSEYALELPPLPESFQLLEQRQVSGNLEWVIRAQRPADFQAIPLPSHWQAEAMSLEDIFISLVAKRLGDTSYAGPV